MSKAKRIAILLGRKIGSAAVGVSQKAKKKMVEETKKRIKKRL